MRKRVTYLRAGMTVGLLGGSFDPPHAGHVHITREALKRFDLDRVLWLISPGNPLKPQGPAAMARRMAAARAIMQHPRVTISDIEARIGTRYTAETIARLRMMYPGVRFVWLMGADNLAQFHRWKDWQSIMETVPMGVLARPGDRFAARTAKAADVYRQAQIRGRDSRRLATAPAPAWSFVNVPMKSLSSSQLRREGKWQAEPAGTAPDKAMKQNQ
ncbi:nicotinate-nucleotide adenylyltransferase [Cognatishimia sp. SS12]|uniref:nicotinate-nucleotide adenylyltransferase n=1 Tax=Cognatishimia sp. SS12 TaxID=2979465 RepID=UPI00232F2595|nr:nicotinate-nucleotide adenylyltransferase [Cognatishimia sp. SS12]MDC0738882.1 nicotinate-nucleotide adenylyltransferase [Cognatishimia sp. SS12]